MAVFESDPRRNRRSVGRARSTSGVCRRHIGIPSASCAPRSGHGLSLLPCRRLWAIELCLLPLYYKSAVVYRRIPSRFFSHIRSRQKNEAGLDVATFELTLLDEQGSVLAQIDGFSMRQVRDPRDGLGIKGAHLSADAARDGFAPELPQRGIVPAQGAKAFMRIIASQRSPEVFVLPDAQDVSSVIRKSPGGMILKRAR
jgi:hypothetical protein